MKLEFTISRVKPPVLRPEGRRMDSWQPTQVGLGRESFSSMSV